MEHEYNIPQTRQTNLQPGNQLYTNASKYQDYIYVLIASCAVWVWNLVSHFEGGT
jgi:hypothetical protein